MLFPAERFESIGAYFEAYRSNVDAAYDSVSKEALEGVCQTIEQCYLDGNTVFVCGNGGSAAIANHFACDHGKGVRSDTALVPRVVSLSANLPLISALANDISYDEVFAYQLASLAKGGDVLVTISSSGDSENVVRAIQWASKNGLSTIAFTGFDGGRARSAATQGLHVDAQNYGVIEDVHQSLMQIVAQYIRQRHIDPGKLGSTKF